MHELAVGCCWPGRTLGYRAGPRGRWDTAQSSTALTLCPVAAATGMTASTLGTSLNTWAASSTSFPKRRSTCSHSVRISLSALSEGSPSDSRSESFAARQARLSFCLNRVLRQVGQAQIGPLHLLTGAGAPTSSAQELEHNEPKERTPC